MRKCILILFSFPLFISAQVTDSFEIPTDTVYLDSTTFLVKVAESVISEPRKLEGLIGSAAVYYMGEEFWFIEDYSYYNNGILKLIDFYYFQDEHDTSGTFFYYKHFYKNGLLKEEGQIRENPFFENVYKFYYKNGNPEEIIHVKDSLYHGSYKIFYKNGQLKTERVYEDGKLIRVESYYDRTGFPLEPGKMEEGSGVVNIYDDNGKLKESYYYLEGEYIKTKKP